MKKGMKNVGTLGRPFGVKIAERLKDARLALELPFLTLIFLNAVGYALGCAFASRSFMQ